MRNVPMFDKPPEQKVELSKALSAFEFRLDRGEVAKWTAIRVKGPRPCDECFNLQYETAGAFGPRRKAKHRRTLPTGNVIELCAAHADLWKNRDAADSGIARAA